MKKFATDQKGVALTIAVVFGTLIALIAGYVLSLSYNQTRQIEIVGPTRTSNYYKAQAGVVDATWRLRTQTLSPGATDFVDPPPYYIDIDTDAFSTDDSATADVKVDIGPADATTGLRVIDSTGLDK